MKIQIELLDEPMLYLSQMKAVDKYIKENTVTIDEIDFFGHVLSKRPRIKETNRNFGTKVSCDRYTYHISCKKTQGGLYKFQVWKAV